MKTIIRPSLRFCLAMSFVSPLTAQEQFRIFAPTKDVAMLVDVSVSVKGDKDGHQDAQRIIQDIVSGRGFNKSRLVESWNVEPNPEMAGLFGNYLGLPPSNQTAELRPLLAEGGNFLAMRIGTVQTVLTGGAARKLKSVAEIDPVITAGYPKTSDMNDKSTCFWLAMARTAGTLSQHSKLGYYLFVVSDEEDDPDYRKDGPPGHTASDYSAYTLDLAKTYPEAAIRGEIARYFDFSGLNSRKVETYKARSDFKQVPIAKFFQRGRSAKKVSLSWYAMGVIPQRVELPRVLQLPPPTLISEPEIPKYEAPKLQPTLQWLGGIEEVTRKRFDYNGPLIVWQIKNAEASGFAAEEKPSLRIGTQTKRNKKMLSSRHDLQTWPLPVDVEPQSYEIALQHGALDSDASIIIQQRSYFWLHTLAIFSVASALGIFVHAWRNLRQASTKPARSAS